MRCAAAGGVSGRQRLTPVRVSGRRYRAALLVAGLLGVVASPAGAQVSAQVSAQLSAPVSAPVSGSGAAGDPARGRAIIIDRQVGMCLLCHSGPFPEEPSMGDLAPDLRGAGSRWTVAQLRQRIADPTRLNGATIMPAYSRADGLWRVPASLRGQPLLSAAQIDDVVAFLATLQQP